MPETSALQIRNLAKNYAGVPALRDLTLELDGGHVVALMGENGCGKTTLLKILAGLDAAYTGTVRIHGHAPGIETKRIVSFLPDTSFLPDSVTAEQALATYADFFPDFDHAKAAAMLGDFGLPLRRRMKELSKGMREKVQLSLAISRRALVYLLDEPISGVDPAARAQILSGILRTYAEGSLLIMSTHLVADVETIADYAVYMRAGQVLLTGDADDLREARGASLDHIFRTEYQPTAYASPRS